MMDLLVSVFRGIRSRLPARHEALQVLGVVLFAVFGWSIRGFLYKIPAFTLYFGLGVNLAILSYMLAFALLESLLVTCGLIVLSLLLPPKFLKVGFAYKAFLIVAVATVAMIVFESYYRVEYFKDIMARNYSSIPPFIIGAIASGAALAALLWIFHRRPRLQQYSLRVMEQLSVFTYVYVPLGVVGLFVVLARNLL